MLTDEQRQIYSRMADLLIPDAEGQLSASQAEVPTVWIDKALGYRPDLVPAFNEAISVGSQHDAAEAIQLLNVENQVAFDALGVLTSGAYFLNPQVQQLIGYPGQVPTPAHDDTGNYIDMLAEVVERGPIYRPTIKV